MQLSQVCQSVDIVFFPPKKHLLFCSSEAFSEMLLMGTNNICFHEEIGKSWKCFVFFTF